MAPPLRSKEEKLQRYNVAESGCWEWAGAKDRDGYGVFGHHRNKQVRAHRASYEVHFGSIQDGALVCHSCDNPSCINPEHLFLGSPLDNTRDMIAKGRRQTPSTGESHPNSKLTAQQVSAIRNRRALGEKLVNLATEFGVTFQHISALTTGANGRALWK